MRRVRESNATFNANFEVFIFFYNHNYDFFSCRHFYQSLRIRQKDHSEIALLNICLLHCGACAI